MGKKQLTGISISNDAMSKIWKQYSIDFKLDKV